MSKDYFRSEVFMCSCLWPYGQQIEDRQLVMANKINATYHPLNWRLAVTGVKTLKARDHNPVNMREVSKRLAGEKSCLCASWSLHVIKSLTGFHAATML